MISFTNFFNKFRTINGKYCDKSTKINKYIGINTINDHMGDPPGGCDIRNNPPIPHISVWTASPYFDDQSKNKWNVFNGYDLF